MDNKIKEIIYVGEDKEFDAEHYYSVNNVNDESNIDVLIEWLNDLKSKGATHIRWLGFSYDGESNRVEANGIYIKTETDDEYNERIKLIQEQSRLKEEKDAKTREKRERSEYLRLKKKYGK